MAQTRVGTTFNGERARFRVNGQSPWLRERDLDPPTDGFRTHISIFGRLITEEFWPHLVAEHGRRSSPVNVVRPRWRCGRSTLTRSSSTTELATIEEGPSATRLASCGARARRTRIRFTRVEPRLVLRWGHESLPKPRSLSVATESCPCAIQSGPVGVCATTVCPSGWLMIRSGLGKRGRGRPG
jgi:hypothetical protein